MSATTQHDVQHQHSLELIPSSVPGMHREEGTMNFGQNILTVGLSAGQFVLSHCKYETR